MISLIISLAVLTAGYLLTALPGAFMSAVSLTYILMANEGFGLSAGIAYPAGSVFAAALLAVYGTQLKRFRFGGKGLAA